MYSLTYIAVVRDCFLTGLLASFYPLLTFPRLNPRTTPPTYHQRFLKVR